MLRTLASVMALALLCAPASAQACLGDDGLSGPNCWAPANAKLPDFPGFQLPGKTACWIDCDPQEDCAQIDVSQPAALACGVYTAALRLSDCNGNALLSGIMVLDYTRTWPELTPPPNERPLQVYRLLVKVDLEQSGPTAFACKVPRCASVSSAFYYGYIDYAYDCVTGGVEQSLVLFHNCDYFIHGNLSAVSGAFHPNETYAIVAPSTMVNPFVFAASKPPSGALVAEAVRNTSHVPGAACLTEDPVSSGSLQVIAQGCGCPLAPSPLQLSARRFTGKATCTAPSGVVSNWFSADLTPGFPWYHMMTTSIGNWTTPATYPGEEAAWVDEVPLLYRDSCTAAAGINKSWADVYYGASTSGGYEVPDPLLTQNFTDLAANLSWRIGTPQPAFWMGIVLRTRNLIYVNVP